MQRFKTSSFEEKKEFFWECANQIQQLKKEIFYDNDFTKVKQVLPIMHMLTYILTYYGLVEHKIPLENLA